MQRKLALITGGTRGIGLGISRTLGINGVDLVLTYLRNHKRAEQTRNELEKQGITATVFQADSGKREDLCALFNFIRDKWGYVDIMVANGSSGVFGPIMDLKDQHWQWTFDSNVRSLLMLGQLGVPLMKGRSGKILAVASIGADRAVKHYAAMGAAKAALVSLVRHLAAELGAQGINVNAICPGLVDTEALNWVPRKEAIKGWMRARTPMGRLTTTEDVGAVAAFLCSEEAAMIQGQMIVVDGGYSIQA